MVGLLQYFLASTGKVHAIARKRAQGSKPKGRIILAISYSSRGKRAKEVVFANNLFFAIELLSELLCLIFLESQTKKGCKSWLKN